MHSTITLLILSFIASIAAPAAAQTPQELLEGAYWAVAINGQPIPAPSPTEDGVVVHEIAVLIKEDGRFTMKVRASARGQAEHERWSGGTYTVTGDTLVVTPGPNSVEREVVRFRWRLDGDVLWLYDEHGHEYRFLQA